MRAWRWRLISGSNWQLQRTRRPNNSDEINLGDLTPRLVGRWYVLLAATLVGAVAAFVVSSGLPKTYEGKATIYVQPKSNSINILRDLPLGLGGNGGAAGYLLTLLQSETMLREVARSLDLPRYPRFRSGSRRDIETAARRLRESMFVTENRNGGIDIIARAHTPQLAADIANRLLDNMGKLVVTTSRRKMEFIASKLDETNCDLRKAEDELLDFQQKNDVASIEEETKGMIQQLIDLDGRLLALDMEIRQVETDLSLGGEINTLVDLEVRRKSLQSSRDLLADQQRLLQDKIGSMPAVAVRYARLQRRVGVLSKSFELLTEQYQLAAISQHGEDGEYQTIDRALPKYRPVAPRVMLNTAIAGTLSLLLAAVVVAGSGRPAYRKPR